MVVLPTAGRDARTKTRKRDTTIDAQEELERAAAAIDEAFARGKRKRIREVLDAAGQCDTHEAAELYLIALESWSAHDPEGKRSVEARLAAAEYAARAGDAALDELFPHMVEIIARGGNVKDWRALRKLARATRRGDLLDDPDLSAALHQRLPDVWVKRALRRDAYDEAVACFFEREGHPRLRLAAPALLARRAPDEIDVLVSCRLSLAEYWIGRGQRRRYRKACRELETLRAELVDAGEAEVWGVVLDDVASRYSRRPALLDEMKSAGILPQDG
jgi:hypothetical protein